MSRFPLFKQIVPMIGRANELERMLGNLTKETPQHLSLVAPRWFGKSVMLAAVAENMRNDGAFECVLEWDLGHQTPESDRDFLDALRKRIAEGLKAVGSELADFLGDEDAGYDELREVIETLQGEGKRILMLWDGLDRPLRSGKLTRNLWDNLLELCRQDAFVLVTASRRKLQELIRDEQSVTSEFWQVFEVVRLEPMTPDDVGAFVAKMEGYAFEPGAMKELVNWSGGIPPLLAWLLNRIDTLESPGVVGNAQVNAAGSELDEQANDILKTIWEDCPAPAKDLYGLLLQRGEALSRDLGKAERIHLVENGLAVTVGNKLKPACHFVREHAAGDAPSAGTLGRLFGSREGYQANIRSVLEHRLNQIPRFDAKLFHMVEQGIADIPEFPDICLTNLTHIEEKALDLIWEGELEPDGTVSLEVISYWTSVNDNLRPEKKNDHVKRMMDNDNWTMPADRNVRLSLLQLLTGSHHEFTETTAKRATKDTYILLNAIHSFRNRSQHASGQQIPLGVAVSAITLCIELLACLSIDALQG